MTHELRKRTKYNIAIIIIALVYIILQIILQHMVRIRFTMYNGVFAALQYGLCLLLLKFNRKSGVRLAYILIGMSILFMLPSILIGHSLSAIPGLANGIFYFITIMILSKYHKQSEIEKITDVVTGVLNRRGLYGSIQNRIDNFGRFSVIYFSLDKFNYIDDNYGHSYGDEVKRIISNRLKSKIGENGEVARLGSSDFVVIVDEVDNSEKLANEMLEVIREKITLYSDTMKADCYMTTYAGLASYPKDAKDYESLIKYADIAMYHAIENKATKVRVFDENMADYLKRQLIVENYIKDGLEYDYFYLVYQPQYHLEGKKLRGFETLIRMKTPDGVFVSPGEFIPVAERSDSILQIDDYVLSRAMREFKEIVEKNNDLTISINVSAKNIGTSGFEAKIRKILSETQFPPANLEIEITEYCMVESMDITIKNINVLKNMGIQIALDDFGTGYTSLNYVSKMPVDLLKVDKSLIDDIEKDDKSRGFVKTVINMGHLMGCEVISEGVENDVQLAYLKEDGCDFVQGYVWGKPLEYEVAKKLAME